MRPHLLDQFMNDLRFGARWLRRTPGFTAIVILTLAIGIGVNSAMFSVVNAVLLRPLPYPAADRLVWIANYDTSCNPDCFNSPSDYAIWAREAPSFESMAAYGNLDLALVSDENTSAQRVAFVTGTFWNLSGAHLELGRLPRPSEPDVLVLSSELFHKQFAGNPQIIGKTLKVDGHHVQVIGVLRSDFRFLFPQEIYTGDELRDIDAYVPLPNGHETPGDPMRPNPQLGPTPGWVRVVGKLKPGATIEQARAELTVIHNRLNHEYPSLFRKKILHVLPLATRIAGESRLALLVLLGAVGFVLVIACANVANLMMARASTRRKEIAVRAALGAGRARVFRQFATESILLALLGGAAGLILAKGAIAAVIYWGSQAVPRVSETSIDIRVLAFTLVVTLATGILFGLAPAASLWRDNLEEILREDARTTSSIRQQRVRSILVSVEVALAVILLTGAGLLLRSFWRMNTFPSDFKPDRILSVKLSLSGGRYNRNWTLQDAYIRQVLDRLTQLPGVDAVGIDCGALNQPVELRGSKSATSEPPAPEIAALRAVSPGYLQALGVSLTRGRWPAPHETFDAVMINQSLAFRLGGPAHDVTGKLITGSFLRGTIAGVVADFKDRQLDSQPVPQVYIPYQMSPVIGSVRVIIRTTDDPQPLAPVIRERLSAIDPDVPVQSLRTLDQELIDSIAPRRFNLYLFSAFALIALLLALIGIYGVISYTVAQRTREIGIRMALGARRRDIVTMVTRYGMTITLTGLAAGLLASIVLSRILASLIYDLSSTDPITLAAVSLTLSAAALLACCRPAYRAAVLDPLSALRTD